VLNGAANRDARRFEHPGELQVNVTRSYTRFFDTLAIGDL
jgi:hypothetical protein